MTATTGDRRLPADAFTPPDAEAMKVGRAFPPAPALFATTATVHGLQVAYDRTGQVVTPLAAPGLAQDASRPSYPGSTSRVLGRIDAELYESAWRDNARLRRERDTARADAATERSLKQDALARLAQAETDLAALRAGRAKDRDRIAELVLTLRALGEASDPAGHESAASGEEGGQ